jgi:hypothetical protein
MSAGAFTVEGTVTNSRKAYLAHLQGFESESAKLEECSLRRLSVSGDRTALPNVADLPRKETEAELN